MKTLLALAVFTLIVAIWGIHLSHSQQPLAMFTCNEGWCVVREAHVENLQKAMECRGI